MPWQRIKATNNCSTLTSGTKLIFDTHLERLSYLCTSDTASMHVGPYHSSGGPDNTSSGNENRVKRPYCRYSARPMAGPNARDLWLRLPRPRNSPTVSLTWRKFYCTVENESQQPRQSSGSLWTGRAARWCSKPSGGDREEPLSRYRRTSAALWPRQPTSPLPHKSSRRKVLPVKIILSCFCAYLGTTKVKLPPYQAVEA
jgi:hypothetical protein